MKKNEIDIILDVMSETNGNIKQTAERLGIARSTIYRKLKKYGISIEWAKKKSV
jgi:transcriptional regulator of acetoin/glycerol metabolism